MTVNENVHKMFAYFYKMQSALKILQNATAVLFSGCHFYSSKASCPFARFRFIKLFQKYEITKKD